jgi:ATP-binding cassette, subfamily B, bacterial
MGFPGNWTGDATRMASIGNRPALEILSLLRPHTKSLILGFLAIAGQSLASLMEPWPLKLVFDHVLNSRPLEGWMGRLAGVFGGSDTFTILSFAVAAVLAIAIFGAICSYLQKYLTTSVGQWVMHDLRRTVYSHIQRLSLSFHDQSRTGDLISRVTSDIDAIQSFITSGLLGTLVNILTLLGMVGVMFYINWRFTLVALSVAPVLFAVVFFYTRRIKKATKEVRKKEGEIVSVVQEVLTAMRVVKAFAREDYEQHRLEEQSLEGVEIALRARSLKAKLSPLVEIIVAVGTCLILWFGARTVMTGEMTEGSLLVFIAYLGKMYKPMQELSKMTDAYTKASVGYDRIREILDSEREVKDLPRAKKAPRFRGKIEFENVSFSYSPESPVLRDVSFTVQPGQVAALVGPTGTGKSTIISLIPRFYDPSSGVVKIDDVDVRKWKQRSIRQQISFVLQESILFHAPIWQNIAYGNPEASRAEILRAAEVANAHEFIVQMPERYDTVVGERGITLSGGQRQRIAIARAVIRNSPILIMDEPSSGLDAASEKLVFEALNRLMKGKTSIVIAHRLSTIREADVIFVVADGTIKETGTHDDLLSRDGLYAEFYRLQFQAAEPSPEVSATQP